MLSVSDINLMAPVLSASTPAPARPTAADFDALVLEVLLRQSGLLEALSGGEEGQLPLVSEMFLQTFARDLAARVDLGFGSMLLQMSEGRKS